ncbi:universal stress protein [Vibrio hannami]|uniref:universal stress protein n=1 Tax=Vibrio hannami TaxID=2717094 RepID=UPI002410A460|nr:universal stress protein [Vibrio hannami]MDG3087728.1 universal stress protein [Vibrio hannami]
MYKHILVAVELSEESDSLVSKGAALAKKFDAELSLIYIDDTHGEIYHELFDLNDEESRANVPDKTNHFFERFIKACDVPVKNALAGSGNIANRLPEIIEEYEADLLLCGHHHDFWSHIISTSRQLINSSSIDILVHPIMK